MFPEYEWGTRSKATVRLSIDAPNVVAHIVKHTQNCFQIGKIFGYWGLFVYCESTRHQTLVHKLAKY